MSGYVFRLRNVIRALKKIVMKQDVCFSTQNETNLLLTALSEINSPPGNLKFFVS